ncbi:putative metalloprotease CJM1_0395 family protein [Paraglaciecola sp. 20A4]|uniref:putative metalloprotease CJM1_0395 family protein n=1 Tax=Paraglaciecola sp. 20A4 TaxID=2687288 RepID=UPI00140DA908|nr:putative metalloprotease CJM1_0395 family protein [Paraglaciecola sp. 20A4]
MNIVTPIPIAVGFPTTNINTEAARRDNTLRETVPATTGSENSAAESGLAGDHDKVRTPVQQLTYERPQIQPQGESASDVQQNADKDNAQQESAGKDDAEQQQLAQQEQQEKAEIDELQKRDTEVRTHEQAHANTGGQYAGAPDYEYTTGPDGKRYATSGEVSIDISEADTPEETIRKMQQVKAAALAPAEPSSQDLRVAAEASQKTLEARKVLAEDKSERTQDVPDSMGVNKAQGQTVSQASFGPELDEIVRGTDEGAPTRDLDVEIASLKSAEQSSTYSDEQRNDNTLVAERVVQRFYQSISEPKSYGLNYSA